jgi:protein-tyrosine phosphatase
MVSSAYLIDYYLNINFKLIELISIDMNILFICNQNKNRSKTAEKIFKNRFKTKSAGLYNSRPVTEKQLSWADVVIVMENDQRKEIAKRFQKQYLEKRILSIDIPDTYGYDQPDLIEILNRRMEGLI